MNDLFYYVLLKPSCATGKKIDKDSNSTGFNQMWITSNKRHYNYMNHKNLIEIDWAEAGHRQGGVTSNVDILRVLTTKDNKRFLTQRRKGHENKQPQTTHNIPLNYHETISGLHLDTTGTMQGHRLFDPPLFIRAVQEMLAFRRITFCCLQDIIYGMILGCVGKTSNRKLKYIKR